MHRKCAGEPTIALRTLSIGKDPNQRKGSVSTTDADLLLKSVQKLGSLAEVHRFLEVSDAFVSNVKAGKKNFTLTQRARLAELVGQRWYDVALPPLITEAKRPSDAEFWRKKLKALRQRLDVLALGTAIVLSALTPQQARAGINELDPYHNGLRGTTRYIQCAQRKRRQQQHRRRNRNNKKRRENSNER